jgi:cell wall-associated NlpC family hydrolase
MTELDPRLHAYRPDLADAALSSRVAARRFIEPRPAQLREAVVSLRSSPRFDAMQVTEALMGETVRLFDEQEGWAWVQLVRDGYVGYVNANALSSHLLVPTHRVAVPSTFLYPEASLKTQPAMPVTLNAGVTVTAEVGAFSKISDGRFVFSAHLVPADSFSGDFVSMASKFRHVPYYWGGKSVHGLDCSGLVQLALEACGIAAPRDSDMQEAKLGRPVARDGLGGLRRGDLVFWDGHVGIMTDPENLLHANGFHMMVVEEPLRTAVERIARQYGQITSIRRL